MKALKLFIGSLVIITFSVLAGCSDNLTSSSTSVSNENQTTYPESDFNPASFNAEYKLDPDETIYLNLDNTSLILINSYSISNCSIDRKDLLILTSNLIGTNSLPCSWKSTNGFMFEDLSIKNISRETKVISVKLTGHSLNN